MLKVEGETSKLSEQHWESLLEMGQIKVGNWILLMKSRPGKIPSFTEGHKKGHLNQEWFAKSQE